MSKNKVNGFLLAESMIALTLATMGVMLIALIVGASRVTERKIELKTDRAYAWQVMKQNNLSNITVHDHLYQPIGTKSIYDTTDKKIYEIKK